MVYFPSRSPLGHTQHDIFQIGRDDPSGLIRLLVHLPGLARLVPQTVFELGELAITMNRSKELRALRVRTNEGSMSSSMGMANARLVTNPLWG